MFSDFANVWTIIALSRYLKPGRPLGLRIAGERVVFFRDASGKAAALIDHGPHRGVALSLGRVDKGEIPAPAEEASVRTGASTLAFRGLYRKSPPGGVARPRPPSEEVSAA